MSTSDGALGSHGRVVPPTPRSPSQRSWSFRVLSQEPTIGHDEESWGKAVLFPIRVICHERCIASASTAQASYSRYRGSIECSWVINRSTGDFHELEKALHNAGVVFPHAALPRVNLYQRLFPAKALEQDRATELRVFLSAALEAVEKVEQESLGPTTLSPGAVALFDFLGLEEEIQKIDDKPYQCKVVDDEKAIAKATQVLPSTRSFPLDAEIREVVLHHSLDAKHGTYIADHVEHGTVCNLGSVESQVVHGMRLRRFGLTAKLGDISACLAEVSGERSCRSPVIQSSPLNKGRLSSPNYPLRRRSSEDMSTSPGSSRTTSPTWSPQSTPATSPPAEDWSLDGEDSFDAAEDGDPLLALNIESYDSCSGSQLSDMDTRMTRSPSRGSIPKQQAVWLEVDLEKELMEHRKRLKWHEALQLARGGIPAPRGAGRIDAGPNTGKPKKGSTKQDDSATMEAEMRRTIKDFEGMAACYRQLANKNDALHSILGYGSNGKTLAIVQQASPGIECLRLLKFSQQKCFRVLGQMLSALSYIHDQGLHHGHLSPESILVEQRPESLQVRVAWTPGQKRQDRGHYFQAATVGFRPLEPSSPAGDVWAIGCIMLAWWVNFTPAPHPWTQFAGRSRLEECIKEAFLEHSDVMPQSLIDMHQVAADAEEPLHTFLVRLGDLLARCLLREPHSRPTMHALLRHRFFEQAL